MYHTDLKRKENTLARLSRQFFWLKSTEGSIAMNLLLLNKVKKNIFTYWSIWCDSRNWDVQNKLNQFPLRMTHLPQCVVHDVLFQTQQRLWLKSCFLTKLIEWRVVNISKRDWVPHERCLSAHIASWWDQLEMNDNDHYECNCVKQTDIQFPHTAINYSFWQVRFFTHTVNAEYLIYMVYRQHHVNLG